MIATNTTLDKQTINKFIFYVNRYQIVHKLSNNPILNHNCIFDNNCNIFACQSKQA